MGHFIASKTHFYPLGSNCWRTELTDHAWTWWQALPLIGLFLLWFWTHSVLMLLFPVRHCLLLKLEIWEINWLCFSFIHHSWKRHLLSAQPSCHEASVAPHHGLTHFYHLSIMALTDRHHPACTTESSHLQAASRLATLDLWFGTLAKLIFSVWGG